MPIRGSTADVPIGSLADVPNQITAARLVATLLCFVGLSLDRPAAGLVFFLLAAATDWADGYWARRWGPITQLGRVLDPLADKLLICGVFVYLSAMAHSDVAPWMAVVVLTREMVVTGLRSFVEGSGGDFSAVMIGKAKMVAQVVAAALSLSQVANVGGVWEQIAFTLVDVAIWVCLVLTVWSGVSYALAARRFVVRAGAGG